MFVANIYNESRCPAAHFLSFEEPLDTYLEPISDHLALSGLALTTKPNADGINVCYSQL